MKTEFYKILTGIKQGFLILVLTVFSVATYSQTTYTFNYTGSTQTIILQAGSYSIECWGADGGNANNGSNPTLGGKGGYSSGVYTNTGTAIFNVYVGGHGGNASGASNVGGGGGGMSDIAPASNSTLIIIAAGGGAGATSGIASESSIGGNGGGLIGGTAQDNAGVSTGTAATGGSQVAGGFAVAGSYGAGSPGGYGYGGGGANGGTAGVIHGAGGAGGNSGTGGWNGGGGGSTSVGGNDHSGGGGSGYYGGGGGRGDGGAGGGGSSYIGGVSGGTTIMFGQPGFVSNPDVLGNGKIYIKELCSITIGSNTGNNLICNGSALTLTTNAISNYTWSNGSNAASIIVSPGVTTTYSLTAMSPSNCITSAAITITVSNGAPVLTLTASSPSVCLGNTVSISAGGALTYTFSGGISNGVAFTPNATTSYTISGQNGCGISTSVTTISIAPLPVIGIAFPTLVCAGNTSTLSGGGATTYTWMPGNLVGSSVLVSPQVNTTYTVTGSTGNCVGINTVNLATNPNPTITVSSTHFSLCAGESATLAATGALSYTWTPGGTGSSIVVSPTSPTAYNVVGINSFGCASSVNTAVIAYAGPNMNVAASTTLVCTGGSVSLNASGATTYSWSTGATTPVTVINPVSSAVYTVVGSTPNSPCATTKTVQVDVYTATISVSSPTAICIGESTTLNASGATTYNWSNGGSGSNVVVSPVTTTGYTVNGISTVGGTTCSSTGTTMVTVNPLPTVTASSTRTNICRFEFANISAGGASTYSWSNGSTTSSISVNPNTNTTYSVIGTDVNGCKESASIQIKVFQCVGISENASESNLLQVYPNPSSGAFHVSANQAMHLILVNELGQLISELELGAENNYSAEIQNLAKGVYFITSTNSDVQLHKKVVIQ